MTRTVTVTFVEPFWVGIIEQTDGERYRVAKIVFGAEPKDYEVYDFLLKADKRLVFSPAVESKPEKVAGNPKRRQRQIAQVMQKKEISSKAQKALSEAREVLARKKKDERKTRKVELQKKRYEFKRKQKKEKKKGH